MENQHRKITGYRELTPDEIALMNEGKELAVRVGEYAEKLKRMTYTGSMPAVRTEPEVPGLAVHVKDTVPVKVQADQRWVAIGVTHLQQGFMSLTRSIAKPETF